MLSKSIQSNVLDLIGELGNITFGSASTALGMIVNQDINISAPKVSVLTKKELIKTFPKPYVLIDIEYKEGLEGHNILLLKPEDAAIIADLMMGGLGGVDKKELNELELSAVQEAMNQMMGQSSTSISEFIGVPVDITPPKLTYTILGENPEVDEIFSDEYLIQVQFDLTIGNLVESSLMQILNVHFTKKIANELLQEI